MRTPTEIVSFKASDGKLFDTLPAARNHEATLEIGRLCGDVCRMGSGGEWDADMISSAILDHAREFYEVLSNIIGDEDE